jgi:hypothetical protein
MQHSPSALEPNSLLLGCTCLQNARNTMGIKYCWRSNRTRIGYMNQCYKCWNCNIGSCDECNFGDIDYNLIDISNRIIKIFEKNVPKDCAATIVINYFDIAERCWHIIGQCDDYGDEYTDEKSKLKCITKKINNTLCNYLQDNPEDTIINEKYKLPKNVCIHTYINYLYNNERT